METVASIQEMMYNCTTKRFFLHLCKYAKFIFHCKYVERTCSDTRKKNSISNANFFQDFLEDFLIIIRVISKPQRISERLSRHNYEEFCGINNDFPHFRGNRKVFVSWLGKLLRKVFFAGNLLESFIDFWVENGEKQGLMWRSLSFEGCWEVMSKVLWKSTNVEKTNCGKFMGKFTKLFWENFL